MDHLAAWKSFNCVTIPVWERSYTTIFFLKFIRTNVIIFDYGLGNCSRNKDLLVIMQTLPLFKSKRESIYLGRELPCVFLYNFQIFCFSNFTLDPPYHLYRNIKPVFFMRYSCTGALESGSTMFSTNTTFVVLIFWYLSECITLTNIAGEWSTALNVELILLL